MAEVIGVRFKNMGKVYYFDPNSEKFSADDHVVVETARGVECGEVAMANRDVADDSIVQPLKKVIRKATKDDLRRVAENELKAKNAFTQCEKKIAERGLEMKLVDVEYTFDNSKILFYFTADGRVDFRELVKDLAGMFRTRIELRQIGVRDEAKMIGGLGICGRPFCCSKFLNDFQPVSTKMAKIQSMSLNPSKISGSCGRLMCCLRYEQEAYEELVKNVPKQGAFVETPTGYGIVTQVNLLRQLVKVKLDGEGEDTMRTYRAVEVATVPGGRPKDGEPLPSVLKYVPAPEPEEEPEDEWAIPEMIVSEPTEEKPENAKRNRNRRNRRGGKNRSKPEGDKPAAQSKPKADEEKQQVKAKPKNKRSGGNKPHTGSDKPKTEKTPAQPRPQQKPAETKEGGDKKRNSRRRYYHRGKPKNKQGGEQKQ